MKTLPVPLISLFIGVRAISLEEIEGVIAAGPFSSNFEDIASQYKVPDWYRDAKFGFYTHCNA